MTDQTAQEPTMEEILASIRRIISEDDAPAETPPAAAAAAPAPAPEVQPEPQPDPAPEPVAAAFVDETPSVQEPAAVEEDVLELTDTYEAPAEESIGDLDVSTPEPFPATVDESVFAPEPAAVEPAQAAAPEASPNALVGDVAAGAAGAAFAGLASSLKKAEIMETPPIAGPTVDELARALLRPMLKDWLDANLPAIVEAQVRKEVERIARSAG